MTPHPADSRTLPHSHSLRVAVRVNPEGWTVTDVRRVLMRAPASAPDIPAEGQPGMWFELRDTDDQVLYHRSLRTPHLDSTEVFSEQTGSIRRCPAVLHEAKLDLIVPDLADASHLNLYGPQDTTEMQRPSVRLLRAEMTELRRRGAAKQS